MSDLQGVVSTTFDLVAMSRFGLVTTFHDPKYNRLKVEDPVVVTEDCKFREYWQLCYSLIRSRATSMLRHVLGFPEMLAGLKHKDTAKQDLTWQNFRKLSEVYSAAILRTEHEIRLILEKSQLGTTAMQWAMKFGRATNWEHINEQMQEWLDTVWGSVLQTMLLENANKELRDKEQRGSTSKSYNRFDKWSRGVDLRLLEKFGRREVEVQGCVTVPANFDADTVFQPFHGKEASDRDSVNLGGITGKADWVTYNTVSVLDIYAELLLLEHAYNTDKWSEVANSWVSHFVPEGQLVSVDKQHLFFVVKVLKGVLVGWPTKKINSKSVELQMGINRLTFLPVLSLDMVDVIPTELCSPLHRHVMGEQQPSGLRWAIVGKPLPVLTWQAHNGFARVQETSLKHMVQQKCDGMDEHIGECSDLKYSHKLALMLMLVCLPDIAFNDALAKLLRRNVQEMKPESGYLEDVDDKQISDCVLIGDQEETKELVKARAKAVTKQANDTDSVRELCKVFFPLAKQAAQRALTKSQAAKVAAHTASERKRLYANLESDATEAIRRELPPTARLQADEKNGRWFISHPDFKQKSVSWTVRGTVAASQLVLKLAWGWHEATTGERAPAYLDFGDA